MTAPAYRLTMELRGARRVLVYKPHSSVAYWEDTHEPLDLRRMGFVYEPKSHAFVKAISPDEPGRKTAALTTIKISVGMKCNLACGYCNQGSQSHATQTSMDEAREFIANFGTWFDGGPKKDGTRIRFELWGGEPFVYPRQIHYIGTVLRSLYPKCTIMIVTNGTLLTDEIIDWIDEMDIRIGLSHDGPGYDAQRGPDPLDNPAQRHMILKLWNRIAPFNRISFNVVLTKNHCSLKAAREYIAAKLGVPVYELKIGGEEILQPYDEGGRSLSPATEAEHRRVLETVFWEAVRGETMDIPLIHRKCESFGRSLAFARPIEAVGQKCGMDREDTIAVNLRGEVTTCQNTAPDSGHLIGHVSDIEGIMLDTSTHLSRRAECMSCPVVQLCQGACMYNEGENWIRGCDNSYTYNKAILATSLYYLTGMVLESIEGPPRRPHLPTLDPVINPEQAHVHELPSSSPT